MAKLESVSPDEHCIVTAAVAEAEKLTDGEIVTVIAQHSDDYRETPIYWAVAAMFLALACVAVFPEWFEGLLSFATGGWQHVYTPSEYLTLVMLLLAAKFVGAPGLDSLEHFRRRTQYLGRFLDEALAQLVLRFHAVGTHVQSPGVDPRLHHELHQLLEVPRRRALRVLVDEVAFSGQLHRVYLQAKLYMFSTSP